MAPGSNGSSNGTDGDDLALYRVLGVPETASDAQIHVAYRRRAAQLARGNGSPARLRQLNQAYQVLGDATRRIEYHASQGGEPPAPVPAAPVFAPAKRPAPNRHTHRRGPHLGLSADFAAAVAILGLAALAAWLIIPRVNIDLSPLSTFGRGVGIDLGAQPQPTAAPAAVASPLPALPAGAVAVGSPSPVPPLTQGSRVTVSNPQPADFGSEVVTLYVQVIGQPAAGVPAWAVGHFRTEDDRQPLTGQAATDASGTVPFTFQVGNATPNYAVQVDVFFIVDDQTLSLSTSFTPR